MTHFFRSTAIEPMARGFEFGHAHARQIGSGAKLYLALFDRVGVRPDEALRLGGLALERIAAFAPALHAEILGMAEGADIEPALLGALNARTEILAVAGVALRGECSTVVKLSPFDGRPVSVQTWDWYAEFADQWLVWEIPHADGRLTRTVTEYGIVGKAGVNERGLGLHFNILHHAADGRGIGVPVHVVARRLLDDARDINHALRIVHGAQVSASSSLTLVTAVGDTSSAVSAELHPGGPGLVFPATDGLLLHTNHFLSAPAREHDTEPSAWPDTLVRHDLLNRRLAGRAGLDVADVLAAMNTHLGGSAALCSHPEDEAAPAGQYATLATIVLDVADGSLVALKGGPCRHAHAFATQAATAH